MNRLDLIKKLKANRKKHKAEFISAKKKWIKKAVKELRKVADRAEKTNSLKAEAFQPLANLPKPSSYVESYNTAIARLEWDVRDTVELDEREFQSWVLDKWQWSGAFVGTTSLYNASNKRR